MFSRLLDRLIRWTEPETAPVEPKVANSVRTTPPTTPAVQWRVAMPGKFRPFILADKETFDDAVTALEEIARNFAEADWHLDWQAEHVCVISKRCPEGELSGVLGILPGSEV